MKSFDNRLRSILIDIRATAGRPPGRQRLYLDRIIDETDAMERDAEKESIHAPDANPSFAPIRTTEHVATPTSRRSSVSRSIARTVSQNGYGVSHEAGANGGEWKVDEEAAAAVPEKDPYEVGWDNGDNDPLCPRSLSVGRKWLIVIIVSSASFCV